MRIFASIISIFILALSIVPCGDGLQQNSVNIEIKAKDHDHNHSDHEDDCTPFCACVCCGSMIAVSFIQPSILSKVEISSEYQFHYNFNYSFNYSEGIWHPPATS